MSEDDILVIQEDDRTVTISSVEEDLLADQPSIAVVTENTTEYLIEYNPGPQGPPGVDGSVGGLFVVWDTAVEINLAAGASETFELLTGSYFFLQKIVAEHAGVRVRGYVNATARTADSSRPVSTLPDHTLNLLFEGVTVTGDLELKWAPAATGYNDSVDLTTPIVIENVSSVSVAGTVTFSYLGPPDLDFGGGGP